MRSKSIFAVVIIFWAFLASPQDQFKVSIFINPFKPFLGLLNLGVEWEFANNYSFYASAEFSAFRSSYLDKIKHPNSVGSLGFRRYFSSHNVVDSGFYVGLSSGFIRGIIGDEGKGNDLFLGADTGYRFFLDDTFYLTPRVLLSMPLRSKRVLPGAEVLLGGIL